MAEGKGQGVRIAVGLNPVRNDKNSTIFYFADVELWEIGFWFWCLVISIACFNFGVSVSVSRVSLHSPNSQPTGQQPRQFTLF